MDKQMTSLKTEVERLKSELKRVEEAYESKLNKRIADLKQEFKSMLGQQDGKGAAKKNADPRVNSLEKMEKKVEMLKRTIRDKDILLGLKVNNVSELFEAIGATRSGGVFTFNSLKFQLQVKTKEIKDDPARNGKFLSFNLQYCGTKDIESQLQIELRLLSQLPGKPNRIVAVNYTIRKPGCYGFSEFIREAKLFDENFGFVKNDTIQLQAFLRFEK